MSWDNFSLEAFACKHCGENKIEHEIAATLALLTKKAWYQNFMQHKYSPAIILGVCTFVADLLVHPTHFYTWYSEALATGVGAGLLSAFFIYRPLKT